MSTIVAEAVALVKIKYVEYRFSNTRKDNNGTIKSKAKKYPNKIICVP